MTQEWKLEDFAYELPEELIAQNPLQQRSHSKLLQVNLENSNSKKNLSFDEFVFSDLASKLNKNDLLVFNNSKVIPARLRCLKKTGGKIEILVIEELPSNQDFIFRANVLIKPGKENLVGEKIKIIGTEDHLEILNKNKNEQAQFTVQFFKPIKDLLVNHGEMPLPPYIKRKAQNSDKTRYQNVFADVPGSIAAPTAGLHFDNSLLKKLTAKGVKFGFVTLHVGIGTFTPVRTSLIKNHKMHEERCEISEECANAINLALKENNRIIAVGTTTLRLLESMMLITKNQKGPDKKPKRIVKQTWKTDIFIKPGFKFQIIDGLITNFHLPRSTLIILISTFLGRDICMKIYDEAIKRKLRFFSYGDAMIVIKPRRLF